MGELSDFLMNSLNIYEEKDTSLGLEPRKPGSLLFDFHIQLHLVKITPFVQMSDY